MKREEKLNYPQDIGKIVDRVLMLTNIERPFFTAQNEERQRFLYGLQAEIVREFGGVTPDGMYYQGNGISDQEYDKQLARIEELYAIFNAEMVKRGLDKVS